MKRALVLGGSSAVGRATARRLLARGWRVDVTVRPGSRVPAALAGARAVEADRRDPRALAAAMGDGADLLLDCFCYTAGDARLLLPLARLAASTVMLSTKAVYADGAGNHSNSDDPPRFDGPVRETQPTVAPGDGDYDSREGYGANKVAAERVLLDSGLPVTVLRSSKIHGPGAVRPREWVFVKRALDRRPVLVLARRGEGVDHPSAAANVASLVELAAAKPGARVLNAVDPDAPSAREIARAVARLLDWTPREVLLDDAPGDGLGATPWDAPHPVVLDMAAAAGLGWEPAGTYAETVAEEVTWLVRLARGDGDETLDRLDHALFERFLDYAAEDELSAGTRGATLVRLSQQPPARRP